MRRILITNDDGITSAGLVRLAEEAVKFGEVWIVAPDHERSAASHSISLRHHIDVFPYCFPLEGVKAFSCTGTPADCIRVGSLAVMPAKPDVVLSGINYGYNCATDLQYSATAGAAFEGAFQGVRSFAISENAGECHEVTDAYLHSILEEYIDADWEPMHIINVNFPGCALKDYKGIKRDCKVSMGSFFRDTYLELEKIENGGMRLMVNGKYNEDAEEDTDFMAIITGHIAVSSVSNIGF